MSTRKHFKVLAMYGTKVIPREFCEECETWALVIREKVQCCDKPSSDKQPDRVMRMCLSPDTRKIPALRVRRLILDAQQYKCFYCERKFGEWVKTLHKGLTKLRLHWDHQTPYSYSRDNEINNFVAACHLCNSFKSDRIFQTVQEARIYVYNKWKDYQTEEEVSDMREDVSE